MIMVVMGIDFLLNNPKNQIHGTNSGRRYGFPGFGFGSGPGGGMVILPMRFCQRKMQYTGPYSGHFQLGVQCAILKIWVLINAASLYYDDQTMTTRSLLAESNSVIWEFRVAMLSPR